MYTVSKSVIPRAWGLPGSAVSCLRHTASLLEGRRFKSGYSRLKLHVTLHRAWLAHKAQWQAASNTFVLSLFFFPCAYRTRFLHNAKCLFRVTMKVSGSPSHGCWGVKIVTNTHSSNTAAQSGRKSKWVRPAPCMPINMSVLCVIRSWSRKPSSLWTSRARWRIRRVLG